MFTQQDRDGITKDEYFNILKLDGDFYVVQSRNTKQYWLLKDYNGKVILFHKHYRRQRYHLQCECWSGKGAVYTIKDHDRYVLCNHLLVPDRYDQTDRYDQEVAA